MLKRHTPERWCDLREGENFHPRRKRRQKLMRCRRLIVMSCPAQQNQLLPSYLRQLKLSIRNSTARHELTDSFKCRALLSCNDSPSNLSQPRYPRMITKRRRRGSKGGREETTKKKHFNALIIIWTCQTFSVLRFSPFFSLAYLAQSFTPSSSSWWVQWGWWMEENITLNFMIREKRNEKLLHLPSSSSHPHHTHGKLF